MMEVAQHVGNNTVRCIMLASSEGLCRDMEVTATGAWNLRARGREDPGTAVQCAGRYPGRRGEPGK